MNCIAKMVDSSNKQIGLMAKDHFSGSSTKIT